MGVLFAGTILRVFIADYMGLQWGNLERNVLLRVGWGMEGQAQHWWSAEEENYLPSAFIMAIANGLILIKLPI